jgi:hypothetical protein
MARLPAAIATTATITAIAVPATASAPSATTAASTTAESAAATPTAAGPTSTAATATFARRPRFVDHDVAAHKILAVQSLNGALGFVVAIDFHKSEPTGLP